jgi:hypothetical protein
LPGAPPSLVLPDLEATVADVWADLEETEDDAKN